MLRIDRVKSFARCAVARGVPLAALGIALSAIGCIDCHETLDTAQLSNRFPHAAAVPPVKCLPTGGEFSYRAKALLKGILPDERKE